MYQGNERIENLFGNIEIQDYTEEYLRKRFNGIYNRYFKRMIDFSIALIGIIILWPFYFVIGCCVAVESGFPVFYRANRGGYKEKNFKILKFRSMVKNADKIGGGTTALNDSRITKVGGFLRKTKLDEIPQLLNVLTGSMSLIGPRPELLQYTEQYEGIEKNILNVRPGITDFSSIAFISLDEIVGQDNADEIYETVVLKKKNQLRLKYVAEVSFTTDIKLLSLTIYKVLQKVLVLVKKQLIKAEA